MVLKNDTVDIYYCNKDVVVIYFDGVTCKRPILLVGGRSGIVRHRIPNVVSSRTQKSHADRSWSPASGSAPEVIKF